MTTKFLPVPDSLAGERLDVLVARMLGISRSAAATLADEGRIEVNSAAAAKSHRPTVGAMITVELPEPAVPNAIGAGSELVSNLSVIYADDDIVVVDKPAGVAAHASPGWTGPNVGSGLAALGYRLASAGPAERQGIVHRLDVGTSGLMVVATSDVAYSHLKDQFRDRRVEKVYHSLVQGHPDPSSGTIDAPIGRHRTADYRFAVVSDGRPSITHYDTVEAFPHATLVEIQLETGRTHQIRVHFSALRHPCCGDLTYGADPVLATRLGLTRQWLHATRLAFTHPGTGQRVEFTSDYPTELSHALTVLAAAS